MKKFLLAILAVFSMATMNAQTCSDLFISSYAEGYGNNRAIELYNPTPNPIDASGYSVGRFSNGATQITAIQLPADMIQPYETYVIVLDKRDSLGTGFETPVWNGYQLYDTCRDALTGMPIIDDAGEVVFCVQYNADGLHLYGTEYNDFLDLEGRGDAFVCPVYNTNNAFYFNGNDAVALITGTTVANDGSNVIDVVGVIGQDPTGGQWATPSGQWITKDKTITRNPNIQMGTGAVIANLGDTLAYADWTIYSKNTFTVLGEHGCTCDPDYTNTQPINLVDFSVYPNPSNGLFTIEAAERMEKVEIYNMVGQMIYNSNSIATAQTFININKASKGIHIVKIYFEDNSIGIKKLLLD